VSIKGEILSLDFLVFGENNMPEKFVSLDVVFHNELIILAGLHGLVKFVDLSAVREVTSNPVAL